MKYHTNIVAVYAVFRRKDEVLLLERCGTGYMDGYFSLVSGHVDAHVSATQALIREIQEEAGVDVDETTCKFLHCMHRKSPIDTSERVDLFFEVTDWEGQITNMEPNKCKQLTWVDRASLPDKMVPEVLQALQNIKLGVAYSQYGWDTSISS